MRRPRDSQRSKLYAWERANLKGRTDLAPLGHGGELPLTQRGAQTLVDYVWRFYGDAGAPPRVRIMGNRGRGNASAVLIKLSSRYSTTCRPWYVLHEVAHSIIERRPGATHLAGHGPQFCALYANLLSRFAGASRREVVASMRAARLKVDGRMPGKVTA